MFSNKNAVYQALIFGSKNAHLFKFRHLEITLLTLQDIFGVPNEHFFPVSFKRLLKF